MRILLITSEEWNDYVYSNGVLTNWFTGFDAEFAQIYTSPGKPINNICNKYFQITDMEMVRSMFWGKRAGREIYKPQKTVEIESAKINARRIGLYSVFKNISLYFNSVVALIRDFIWCNGKYDEVSLKRFVDEFNPDIVFCPRRISPKLIRLEKIISTMTSAPFIAFTGDDEASLDGISVSPLYWLRKIWIHNNFKKHIKIYSYYLMHSADQAKEYFEKYRIATSTFFKCGDFPKEYTPKPIGKPIRLVYAGRLYCNRWKSLAEIGKALQVINTRKVKMVLDVYTPEKIDEEQKKALSEDKFIFMKGCISPDDLKRVYEDADIALHVESMDMHYRMITRVSFSTKIIDLMASTCAILAICWEKHCGYQYLNVQDAAFCICKYEDILPQLQHICDNPFLISEYARKAYDCGKRNHERKIVQSELYRIMTEISK